MKLGKKSQLRWPFVALVLSVVGGWIGPSAPVLAYSSFGRFLDPTTAGGGGGRLFTGSPMDGLDCRSCHHGGYDFPFEIEGLPDTYAPGASYEVTLTWPLFEQYQSQVDMLPMPPETALSVMLEFVAESGRPSGDIEVKTVVNAGDDEKCRVGTAARATDLYYLQPGADSKSGLSLCSTQTAGDRCLLHLRACLPKQIRFEWHAPSGAAGPVWFAANMVTSINTDSEPGNDGVYSHVTPILPANYGAEALQTELQGQCSLGPALGHTGLGTNKLLHWLVPLAVLAGLLWRRRPQGKATSAAQTVPKRPREEA